MHGGRLAADRGLQTERPRGRDALLQVGDDRGVALVERAGHGRRRPRQDRGAPRRRLAARRDTPAPPEPDPATFEHLTTWDYADAPRTVRPQLDRIRRQTTFNAVIKLEPGAPYAYAIDLGFCKGCGLCVAECPFCAIEMVSEDI